MPPLSPCTPLSLWAWPLAGHVVSVFVDVKNRRTKKKKKKSRSDRPTYRIHPSIHPGAHSLLFGLDAAGSRSFLHLDLCSSPRRSAVLPAGLRARQRGWGMEAESGL